MLQILLLTFVISNVESVSIIHNIPDDIVLLHSDEKGLSFQYSFPLEQLQQKQIMLDGDEYYIFDIKNSLHSNPPGTFDIPSKEVIIGIPQEGDIYLSTYINFETKINNIKIAPVPYKTFEGLLDYQIHNKINFDIYPTHRVQLKSIEYFRDVRIARIKIYPIQYNYLTQQVNIANDIRISIQFSQAAQVNSKSDYFDGVFKDIMLNGEQAINWKLHQEKILNSNTDHSRYPLGFTNWYKVKIESTGVYKISYNELRQAGVPVNIIDPRTFRLFNIGDYISNVYYPDTMVEIPLYIVGEEDSLFDQKDYILFYGVSPSRYNVNRTTFYNNPYTRYNYYWLTWGISTHISGFGRRIEIINPIASGNRKYYAENYVHLEMDRDCPARNGLLWIWDLFSKPRGSFSKEFNVLLDIISPESLINLKGRMYACSVSNWLKITINNLQLDSFTFPGYYTNPPPFNFEINKRIPLLESNILSFQLYNFPGQDVYLDFLDCRYLQKLIFPFNRNYLSFYSLPGNYDYVINNTPSKLLIFDVTDYYKPKLITNYYKNRDTIIFGVSSTETTYYYLTDETKIRKVISIEQRVPNQSHTYANQDYYIITPDEFYESALLLENYRRNNIIGLNQARVKAIKISQIYDDYTFGIEEPGAIKRLFKKNRPYYGLLLGDGTYDYRNILNLSNFPTIPPFETGYDIDYQVYSTGAIALDAWYADFDGYGASPDMALGRVTARSNSDVRNFYNKIIAYESHHNIGMWNKRFLFLSDDEWKGQGTPDEFGFEHISNNENLENFLINTTNNRFSHFEQVKIYLTEYPFTETRDKRKARETLLSELSKGIALWCFFGHGAGFQLCHEQTLHINHIPLVNTNKRNFIAFYGSCGVGRFEDTKYESIAEELVRKFDAGIATIAASKATYSGINYYFANLFFNYLIMNPDSTIGRGFLRGWFVDSSYHLFGDPATKPMLPNRFENIMILPDTFQAGKVINTLGGSFGQDKYSASAYVNKWRRLYTSQIGTITYNLNGYEVFRGIGNSVNDSIKFSFVIPTGLPRRARYDILNGGGNYVEIENSSSVNVIAYSSSDRNCYSYVKPSIYFDTLEFYGSDNEGPVITFYNNRQRINNYDKVPKQFNLSGIFFDSSGIFLSPIIGYNPRLIIKKMPNRVIEDIDVSNYFSYDIGNYYQGRITYPVTLDTGNCLITFRIADNYRNISIESVAVFVEPFQSLQITNVLFYSNPNAIGGFFTFEVSKPALIDIKIYSINGRLIKSFNNIISNYGYNQIVWDGYDDYGRIPANGVYLYKINAQTTDISKMEKNSVIEKFVIFK